MTNKAFNHTYLELNTPIPASGLLRALVLSRVFFFSPPGFGIGCSSYSRSLLCSSLRYAAIARLELASDFTSPPRLKGPASNREGFNVHGNPRHLRARANHHSRWIRVRHIWASKTRRCARRLGPLNLVGGVALLLRIRFLSRRISTLLVCPDCVTIGGCVAAQCVALPYILRTNLRFLFRPQAPRASELQTSPHDSPSPPFLTTSSHRRASEMTPTTFPPARGTLYAPEAPHYSLPALMVKRAWLANRILEMAILRHPTATNPKG